MAPTTHTPAEQAALDGLSMNIAAERLQQLRQLFPEVFAEDKVDFGRLKAALGEAVSAPTNERYGISWPGKSEAFREIQKQTTATLVADKDGSVDFETTENVFIEGENLEVLRVLQKSYYGKVKMIYIDPPYNTGNDSFVYPDDYSERRQEYEQRAGLRDEEGFLNKQDMWRKNAKENGQFHSAWLSMMYPRLYLARNLLREDGVIFVSIDDNEVANLRLLMDEVFGEENFEGHVHWRRRHNQPNDKTKMIGLVAEHILVFARNSETLKKKGVGKLPITGEFSNPDNDPNGEWASKPWKVGSDQTGSSYKIISPSGVEFEGEWMGDENTYRTLLGEGKIYFPKKGEGWPRKKYYKSDREEEGQSATNWFSHTDFGHNQEGNDEATSVFTVKNLFSNPKPSRLLKNLMRIGNLSNNEIVLDFFAGSGTTAHAVMELNKEDGGNRKFICVQMPEKTDESSEAYKAGYHTIADISRARIGKVSEKLRSQQGNTLDFGETPQDTGFKSFKLHTSNFKQWRGDTEGAELAEQIALFVDTTQPATQHENMLFELLLKAGIPLTAKVETVQAGEHSFFSVPDYSLCVVFAAITPEIVEAIRAQAPKQVICLDNLFRDNDQFLTNTRLQLRDDDITLTVI